MDKEKTWKLGKTDAELPTADSAANGLVSGLNAIRINKLRAVEGKPPLPERNLVGCNVSWTHKSNGKTYFFSGVIVDLIQPTPNDPFDVKRKWRDARCSYKIKMPGEGKSYHPRAVVWLATGKGYRMPNMHRLAFHQNDD